MAAAWRPGADHVVLRVRLTPRSSADRIEAAKALSDGSAVLVVRVRALPEDGAANRALLRLLADALNVPPTALTLVAGAKARTKEIRIAGDPASLEIALTQIAKGG